ncbi:MAG: hypothetical protein ABI968_03040 [Acidobacteriota bacterium]
MRRPAGPEDYVRLENFAHRALDPPPPGHIGSPRIRPRRVRLLDHAPGSRARFAPGLHGKFGARKPECAERAVWKAAFDNMIFLGSVGVLFLAFADPLIRLFTTDPAAAITIAFSTLAVASSLLFRRGKWKEKTISTAAGRVPDRSPKV